MKRSAGCGRVMSATFPHPTRHAERRALGYKRRLLTVLAGGGTFVAMGFEGDRSSA